MRESVNTFSEAMEKKLCQCDPAKGADGWVGMSVSKLYNMLIEEVVELGEAILDEQPSEVMEEAVDVANFAMMVYDNINRSADGS